MPRYYVVITPFFPKPDSFRGPYVLDQVKAIERNSDYKVIVLMPSRFYHPEDDYQFDGIQVHRFTDYNLPSNVWPNSLTDWLSIRSMLKKLGELGVDVEDVAVAHAHVTRFGVWAKALKKRNPRITSIVQHHGFDVMSETDGILANYNFHKRHCISYGRNICNAADINVGVSRATLDYVKAVPGIKLKNEYVLYNGVDTSIFHPTDKSCKRNGGLFTIGCVANFWELKDQMTLIRAAESLIEAGQRNMRVIFIGTGYTRQQCEDYVAEKRLSGFFEFRNEVDHSQLPDFYRGLDLFVLPSYWEAFGCVYTEAYACGVPFIGVNGQGIAEIVSEENADRWLIGKGDAVRLSKAILTSIQSPSMPQLNTPIDIDSLISAFLEVLEKRC
ncbi:MAG: glycosyltransferase family 4 protein [Bacteroides sp.]|nr:glycosyltransferase family 4 protein [Bacteroides sp.]